MLLLLINLFRNSKSSILPDFRKIAWMIFLLLIPVIYLNSTITNNFFVHELNVVGMDAKVQEDMRDMVRPYLKKVGTEPALFYFDELDETKYGYIHESSVIAGFEYWTAFRDNKIIDRKLVPLFYRTNTNCPEDRNKCLDRMKSEVVFKDGQKGILHNSQFTNAENFYAFKLKDLKVIDITDEVKSRIGL